MDKLVEALIKKQEELKLTESAFSRRVGMSRPMWYMIKNGRRKPGLDILKKIIAEFPEMQLLVYQSMSETTG